MMKLGITTFSSTWVHDYHRRPEAHAVLTHQLRQRRTQTTSNPIAGDRLANFARDRKGHADRFAVLGIEITEP